MSKNEDFDKELDSENLQKFFDKITPEMPVQYQKKDYKSGWDHERAQRTREQILITKPWLYSRGAITNLGKKISSRNAIKHGLYCKVHINSPLEAVELSVAPEDAELKLDVKYTKKQKNKPTQE